jgi:hypothetical protein
VIVRVRLLLNSSVLYSSEASTSEQSQAFASAEQASDQMSYQKKKLPFG